MSWDLICLKTHEHRQEGDETYACLYKNLNRIDKGDLNAWQYNVRVVPLPLLAGNSENKQLVNMEEALFKVVVDLNENKVMFDIGGADAALPTLLRGGGLGSLAISELIIWAKKHYPEFGVVSGTISPALLNYPNSEVIAVHCLKNMGFSVARSQKGGLQFMANNVTQLKSHVNNNKVESATPGLWFSNLMQDNLNIARQMKTQSEEISNLKEQLHLTSSQKQSTAPWISGLLMGVVAGSALASVLFNL